MVLLQLGVGSFSGDLAEEGLREEIRILNAHLVVVEAIRRRDSEVRDDS